MNIFNTKKRISYVLVIFTMFSLNVYAQNYDNRVQKMDTSYFVSIGNIKQYLSVKGAADKPIVLYLHGGPGAAASGHSSKITSQLENDFLVIHWDQRGAGETLKNNSFIQPTLQMMVDDADELLHYIITEFNRENIYMVANSWGAYLGINLAEKHPQHIVSLVLMSPIVNLTESQKELNKVLIKHYKIQKQLSVVEQLKEINIPYKNATDMAVQFRWMTKYKGQDISDEEFKNYQQFFNDWYQKWGLLYNELYSVDLIQNTPNLLCEVVVFSGDEDLIANYKLTNTFFKKLKTEKKELYWFEGVGHQIPMAEPNKMQDKLKHVFANIENE